MYLYTCAIPYHDYSYIIHAYNIIIGPASYMCIPSSHTVKTNVLWWHKECAVVAQLCYILFKIGQNIAQMCYHSTSFLTGHH